MKESLILDREVLERISNSKLFYPCSGNDLQTPIKLFSPYVTDFWFVDRGYFSRGHSSIKNDGLDAPADKQRPVLEGDGQYRLLNTEIDGPPNWHSRDVDITPCILSETYRHIQTNREVTIHRRRGYGFSALRKEKGIDKLGVFFYRGDSAGEGGSGNLWLKPDHLDEVCNKLFDGGLIVSDGSDGTMYYRNGGIYKELWKYRQRNYNPKKLSKCPEELIKNMKSFTDIKGRRFSCIGYAGRKYAPTMIWQVHKNAQSGKVE
jgi:hypothetical protein